MAPRILPIVPFQPAGQSGWSRYMAGVVAACAAYATPITTERSSSTSRCAALDDGAFADGAVGSTRGACAFTVRGDVITTCPSFFNSLQGTLRAGASEDTIVWANKDTWERSHAGAPTPRLAQTGQDLQRSLSHLSRQRD